MTNKKMTVKLGGNELTLDVGSIEFFQQFFDCTGIDLIEIYSNEEKRDELAKKLTTIESFKFSVGVVYAGYAAEMINSDKEIVYKHDTIKKLIHSLPPSEAAQYTKDYFDLLATLNSNGEVEEKKAESQSVL